MKIADKNRQDLIEFSSRLIAIPSTKDSPNELQKVLDLARSEVAQFQYKTFNCDGNPSMLIFNQWPDNGKFKVLLNAHLDVVPGKTELFSAKVLGGKLFGRGAIDMKAAAAAEILAFKNTADKVNYPLALQLVTDEEVGGHKGVKHQISQGVLSDFYLCGEYSGNNIGCDTKGVLWIKITAQGTNAHGAYLWDGVNAITKLAKEIQSIAHIFPVPKSAVWKTTCNFGTISGGNAVNQVPDSASVTLDIRRIPTDHSGDIIKKIKSHLVFPDTQLEVITDEPYNHADRNHSHIQKLDQVIKQVTGKKPEYVKFHGASDARHYSQTGCTAIDIGPTGAGLHSDNEWIDIKSLEDFYNILQTFLVNL